MNNLWEKDKKMLKSLKENSKISGQFSLRWKKLRKYLYAENKKKGNEKEKDEFFHVSLKQSLAKGREKQKAEKNWYENICYIHRPLQLPFSDMISSRKPWLALESPCTHMRFHDQRRRVFYGFCLRSSTCSWVVICRFPVGGNQIGKQWKKSTDS